MTVQTSYYSDKEEKYNIKRGTSNYFNYPTDPLWSKQWSLVRAIITRDNPTNNNSLYSIITVKVEVSQELI